MDAFSNNQNKKLQDRIDATSDTKQDRTIQGGNQLAETAASNPNTGGASNQHPNALPKRRSHRGRRSGRGRGNPRRQDADLNQGGTMRENGNTNGHSASQNAPSVPNVNLPSGPSTSTRKNITTLSYEENNPNKQNGEALSITEQSQQINSALIQQSCRGGGQHSGVRRYDFNIAVGPSGIPNCVAAPSTKTNNAPPSKEEEKNSSKQNVDKPQMLGTPTPEQEETAQKPSRQDVDVPVKSENKPLGTQSTAQPALKKIVDTEGDSVIGLEDLVNIIKANLPFVRAHKEFKSRQDVKKLLLPMSFPSDETDNGVDQSIIHIGKRIFLSLNRNYSKIMQFQNRLDFVLNHVRYYFSPENLRRDTYLTQMLRANGNFCPFTTLLEFRRLKCVQAKAIDLIQCANAIESVRLEFREDGVPIGYRLREQFNLLPCVNGVSAFQVVQPIAADQYTQTKQCTEPVAPSSSIAPQNPVNSQNTASGPIVSGLV